MSRDSTMKITEPKTPFVRLGSFCIKFIVFYHRQVADIQDVFVWLAPDQVRYNAETDEVMNLDGGILSPLDFIQPTSDSSGKSILAPIQSFSHSRLWSWPFQSPGSGPKHLPTRLDFYSRSIHFSSRRHDTGTARHQPKALLFLTPWFRRDGTTSSLVKETWWSGQPSRRWGYRRRRGRRTRSRYQG